MMSSRSGTTIAESAERLNRQIVRCRRCPRLIDHCRSVASTRRRAFADWTYWGKPVPNFGDLPAKLLIVGLAPAAHGANRTGRMFTGDRSGEWLFRALHRAGFASQPDQSHRDDGMRLIDTAITAVCHCAPPQNRPTGVEIAACRDYLQETFRLCQPRVLLALGRLAYTEVVALMRRQGLADVAAPQFKHGGQWRVDERLCVISSYHPSQQNTFTGRLTESMLDEVMTAARDWIQRVAS